MAVNSMILFAVLVIFLIVVTAVAANPLGIHV